MKHKDIFWRVILIGVIFYGSGLSYGVGFEEDARRYYKQARQYSECSLNDTGSGNYRSMARDYYNKAIRQAQRALEGYVRSGDENKARQMRDLIASARRESKDLRRAGKIADKKREENIADALWDRKLAKGMTMRHVRRIMGSPDKIITNTGSQFRREEWVYRNKPNEGTWFYVYFTDEGLVNFWEEYKRR